MKTKRIISLLFAACMCIMLLSTTAFAAGAPHLTTGGTPTFSADEGYTETDVPEQYVTVYVNDSGLDAANLTATLNDTTHFTIRPKTGEESDWNTGTTGTLVRNAEVPAGSNVRFAVQPQAGIEAGTYNTTIEITADQVDPPLSVDVRFTVSRQSVSVSISKGVTQGGSLIPPAKTFEFELDFVEEGLTAGALCLQLSFNFTVRILIEGDVLMNLIGKWEVSAVLSALDGEMKWITREEADGMEDFDLSMFDPITEFTEDGVVLTLFRIPEKMPQEEIDNAISEGMERTGDFLVTGKQEWKEENGKFLYNTEIEGAIFDEEVSPWVEIPEDENGEITLMGMLRMKHI